MSEVKRLTKADILGGKNAVTYVMFEDLGGELPLRSLTEGQWAQIEAIRTRGGKVKGMPVLGKDGNPDLEKSQMGIEIDMEQMSLAEHEADCLAVFYGVADTENWTVDDVKKLNPPGIVKAIAKEVYELSGVKPKRVQQIEKMANKVVEEGRCEEVKSFRKQ